MAFVLTKKSSEGVPPGAYAGEFATVEEINNDYGAGLKWVFRITDGNFKGQTASRFTGISPTPKNTCGKMLDALVGKTLADGEDVEPALYIGHKYTLIVKETTSGGTRIETVAKT